MYTVKEKGGKPDGKAHPPSLWFKTSMQKPQVWINLKVMPGNLKEIVHS
jgi:hypothetical protein